MLKAVSGWLEDNLIEKAPYKCVKEGCGAQYVTTSGEYLMLL